MIKIICLAVALLCWNASAQYRVVNGQIYRADDQRVWRAFPNLQIVSVFPDGCLEVCEVQDASAPRARCLVEWHAENESG